VSGSRGRCGRRSWSHRRSCSGSSCRCRTKLYLKRADVDAAVPYAIKVRTALVVERRRSEAGITGINGGAASQQLVRECQAAIVLQRAKHRIGVNLITRAVQKTASVIAAEIVSMRCDRAAVVEDVFPRRARVEDCISGFNRRPVLVPHVGDATATPLGR
jgi:hypothetical protein